MILLFTLALEMAARAGVLPAAAGGRWLEVTPSQPGRPAQVLTVASTAKSIGVAGVEPGIAVLCVGGEGLATLCQQTLLQKDTPLPVAGPVPGVRVTGRILIGKSPAAGTWFGILPKDLALRRSFAIPLERKGEKLIRTIACDERGRFTVPLLAPGEYRLDIHSPGGRIDPGESLTVPTPEQLVVRRGKELPGPPLLDLGDLVLEDGVRLEVSVLDTAGQPVRGAGIGAGQRRPGGETVFFEARSDPAGRAMLTRLDPALPVDLTCQGAGYVRQEQHFASVPAAAHCVLAALAEIRGRVLAADEQPLAGATVSLRPEGRSARTARSGEFSWAGIAPGSYTLTVAAPGFRALSRRLQLAAEERVALAPIRLEPAGGLAGKVVDGATHEPVAGAAVRVVEPVGFDATETMRRGASRCARGRQEPSRSRWRRQATRSLRST